MHSLQIDNVEFPQRKSIIKTEAHYTDIIDEVKKIDVDKVSFEKEDFIPKSKIIQKQKVYFWIRLYLKQEIEIQPETEILIHYLNGLEKLETQFMYFGKKGLERNKDGQIINFNPEDDKRILCLLIDSEKVDINNQNIPYMKTLFPLGKFYQPQYVKKFDFEFLINGETPIDFYDIDF
jgi:hypothetical protein